MTKRHFEWAAGYTKRMRSAPLAVSREQAQAIEDAFVDLFRQFGPRFDEMRFREACSVGKLCRYCGKPRPDGYTVTCGRSECQQRHAGYDGPAGSNREDI